MWFHKENLIVPGIVTSKPEDLPDPCTCGKWPTRTDMSLQGSWNQSVANTASVKEVNPAKTLSLNNLIFVNIILKYCLSLYLSDSSS